MDDTYVFYSSLNDQMSDLKSVFDRIRQAKLKLKPSKCHLFQNQIKFLGHIVTDKGIFPDPDKVKAINEMPSLKMSQKCKVFWTCRILLKIHL